MFGSRVTWRGPSGVGATGGRSKGSRRGRDAFPPRGPIEAAAFKEYGRDGRAFSRRLFPPDAVRGRPGVRRPFNRVSAVVGMVRATTIRSTGVPLRKYQDPVRQANWRKAGGESPPERRSNQPRFLREPCVGPREGSGEASVAVHVGGLLSTEKVLVRGAEAFGLVEGNIAGLVMVRGRRAPRCQRTHARMKAFRRDLGGPPPHLGLSAGVAKGRQNCRSRRRTGRRSQTRS